jgi:hypothetical protein
MLENVDPKDPFKTKEVKSFTNKVGGVREGLSTTTILSKISVTFEKKTNFSCGLDCR